MTSATRSRRWRHSGRASGQPASRPPSSPGWAAAASPRTCSPTPSATSPAGSTVRVLDSTDPAAVEAAWDGLDPLATLVIVATKSGTTTESLAFQADAWARIHAALRAAGERRESPADLMIAITDPGRSLEAIPHHDGLREVFLNPEDVGGRYSALTYVGLVPASLLGIDLDAFLAAALAMLARTHATAVADNPGAALGVTLGALWRAGRDKLTLVADPAVARFGAWLEQLIAESTGKHGVGIVPIAGEPLGEAAAYRPDRIFVRLALDGAAPPAPTPAGTSADELLEALAAAGHPVLRIRLADPIDLAAEFVRWEVATAFAGAVARDQPVRRAQRHGVQGEHEARPGRARADGRLPGPGGARAGRRPAPGRGLDAPRRQRRRNARR